MYANIHYAVDRSTNLGQITLFTWDKNGNRIKETHDHKSWLYYEDPKGTDDTIYGTKCKKVVFDNIWERYRWLNENGKTYRTFENLKPEAEFLINKFEGQNENPDFQKFQLRTHYIDIEVQVEEEFPEADDAKYPINIIDIFDSADNQHHCWILLNTQFHKPTTEFPAEIEGVKVNSHVFTSEFKMLQHFAEWFNKNNPDVITGWNIQFFDIPYIVNRIGKICGEDTISLLSPVGQVKADKVKDAYQRENNIYRILGVSALDYRDLYKDKFNTLDKKPDYKLETISTIELGVGKLSYDCTIKEFWQSDMPKFMTYCCTDVYRVFQLEKKLRYIELARVVCNYALVPLEKIFNSIPTIYGQMTMLAREMNQRIISTHTSQLTKEAYEGAFVKEPPCAVFRDGCASVDAKSLYPNVMRSMNTSPEVKIGKIMDKTDPDNIVIKLHDGHIKTINAEKFEKLKQSTIISPSGAIFSKTRKGLMQKFCEKFYNKRVDIKKKLKNVESEIIQLSAKGQDTSELEELAIIYDTYQYCFKIFMNSLYGASASPFFPLFDIDCAMTITSVGQEVIKEAQQYMNTVLCNNYKEYLDANYSNAIIYGDTDSCYFDIAGITRKHDRDWNKICKEVDQLLGELNTHIIGFMHDKFNCDKEHVTIEFDRETVCESAIFLAKKRYILRVINTGKKDKATGDYIISPKYKYTGVEVKRSEHPEFVKDIMKDIIVGTLEHRWTNSKFKEYMTAAWKNYSSKTPDDIGLWKGYNKGKERTSFLQAEKGANAVPKSCIYHNDIVKELKLSNKYDELRVGDRVRFVKISSNNKFGINSIAWSGDYYKEFKKLFTIDHQQMFEDSILSPMEDVIKASGWTPFDPSEEALASLDDL